MNVLGTLTHYTPHPDILAATQSLFGPFAIADGGPLAEYQKFNSPLDVDGLAKVENGELHILTVISHKRGCFRDFIAQSKQEFPRIYLWEVWNPTLPPVLQRYGFVPTWRVSGDGERIIGFVWTRKGGDA